MKSIKSIKKREERYYHNHFQGHPTNILKDVVKLQEGL